MKTSEGGANGNLLNRNTLNGNAALFITVMGVRRGGKCLYLPTKKKKRKIYGYYGSICKNPPIIRSFFLYCFLYKLELLIIIIVCVVEKTPNDSSWYNKKWIIQAYARYIYIIFSRCRSGKI